VSSADNIILSVDNNKLSVDNTMLSADDSMLSHDTSMLSVTVIALYYQLTLPVERAGFCLKCNVKRDIY
jgi:hypothetical protein